MSIARTQKSFDQDPNHLLGYQEKFWSRSQLLAWVRAQYRLGIAINMRNQKLSMVGIFVNYSTHARWMMVMGEIRRDADAWCM